MSPTLKKILFRTAVTFISVTIFSLTIGQILPYEFADYTIKHKFYDTILTGLPIAILLTLSGTLKPKNTKTKNWILASATILTSIFSRLFLVRLMFSIGFGAWITLTTLYEHKTDNREIKVQLYDIGALGYRGKRIVEVKPFLNFWILPTPIDTSTIHKEEWTLVNKQGDIKFP